MNTASALQEQKHEAREGGSWRRVSLLGYVCICVNALLIGLLAAGAPHVYGRLTREDAWVENATALLFLLSGALLFSTAAAERRSIPRCAYVLGGVAMVFIAGEEISWGQRVLGFDTPCFLTGLNAQNEINIHNIDTTTFHQIYRRGAPVLCVVIYAAFMSHRKSLFGIPLPSILLTLGIIMMMSHHHSQRATT